VAENTPPLFWVWKCGRNWVGWFFLDESHVPVDAPRLPKAERTSNGDKPTAMMFCHETDEPNRLVNKR